MVTTDQVASPPTRPGRCAERQHAWAVAGVVTGLVVALCMVVALSARLRWRRDPDAAVSLDEWVAFDADWYVGIVREAYAYVVGKQSSVTLAPASATGLRDVVGDLLVAARLPAALCALAAVVLLALWMRSRPRARRPRTTRASSGRTGRPSSVVGAAAVASGAHRLAQQRGELPALRDRGVRRDGPRELEGLLERRVEVIATRCARGLP